MYELKKMENLLGPGPRLMKKELTGPRLRNTGIERGHTENRNLTPPPLPQTSHIFDTNFMTVNVIYVQNGGVLQSLYDGKSLLLQSRPLSGS